MPPERVVIVIVVAIAALAIEFLVLARLDRR